MGESHSDPLNQVLPSDDALDPRSPNYERTLVRPAIRWRKIALFTIALILGTWCVHILLRLISVPPAISLYLCLTGALAAILLYLKRIIICLVRIYQHYAPAAIRNKCRFEPSCSQYMILSLQKYGLWKGLWKGIHRLWRCHKLDGGFDAP